MAFRYQLRDRDGEDLGEASYSVAINAGDTIHINGTQRVRVTAVVPIERVQEHVTAAMYGLLEVEPVA